MVLQAGFISNLVFRVRALLAINFFLNFQQVDITSFLVKYLKVKNTVTTAISGWSRMAMTNLFYHRTSLLSGGRLKPEISMLTLKHTIKRWTVYKPTSFLVSTIRISGMRNRHLPEMIKHGQKAIFRREKERHTDWMWCWNTKGLDIPGGCRILFRKRFRISVISITTRIYLHLTINVMGSLSPICTVIKSGVFHLPWFSQPGIPTLLTKRLISILWLPVITGTCQITIGLILLPIIIFYWKKWNLKLVCR